MLLICITIFYNYVPIKLTKILDRYFKIVEYVIRKIEVNFQRDK